MKPDDSVPTGIDGILLAAGRSRRAGSNKLNWDIDGQTVLVRAYLLLRAVCDQMLVVVRADTELPDAVTQDPTTTIIINPHAERGMFSSVQSGVAAVTGSRFLLLPADIPLIQSATVQKLINRPEALVIPTWLGKGGHPVLIGAEHIPRILSAAVDSSLRQVLRQVPRLRLPVNDPAICLDIDHPEDLERARNLSRNSHLGRSGIEL